MTWRYFCRYRYFKSWRDAYRFHLTYTGKINATRWARKAPGTVLCIGVYWPGPCRRARLDYAYRRDWGLHYGRRAFPIYESVTFAGMGVQ